MPVLAIVLTRSITASIIMLVNKLMWLPFKLDHYLMLERISIPRSLKLIWYQPRQHLSQSNKALHCELATQVAQYGKEDWLAYITVIILA